jgi:hypothetical protein
MKERFNFISRAVLLVSIGLTLLGGVSCQKNYDIPSLVDQVWTYSQEHTGGFTIHIPDFKEPASGIMVAYAATQNSYGKESLYKVVRHAIEHEGYVGGWLDKETGILYFDSSRLFPEDQRELAIAFAKVNSQLLAYVLSTGEFIDISD